MGGTPSDKGMKINFYDENGSPDPTRPSFSYRYALITGQAQLKAGVGSDDWLKEVYLAPDPASLFGLLRAFQATGCQPPLTSASSQQVTLHWVDSAGEFQKETFKSVIGTGPDVTVPDQDGNPQPLRLFEDLHVTQGDASDPANGLFDPFKEGSSKIAIFHAAGKR